MRFHNFTVFFILYVIFPAVSFADIKVDGYFIANHQKCPAYQSFKKKTNPDNVHLIEDMSYPILSKNKSNATHYRIKIKDASPQQRWVSATCGKRLTDCQSSSGGSSIDPDTGTEIQGDEYLLALSWQPAFCQTHPAKSECKNQTKDRYDASHFTLHGLWPQPRSNTYCGVSRQHKKLDKRKAWGQLPALALADGTMRQLTKIMPGVASFLQRHEWIKHGTCYSKTAEEYYQESIQLTLEINRSPIRDLLAKRVGKQVTTAEIKDQFNQVFGAGAGDKIKVRCNAGMISELWINLKGSVTQDSRLATLLHNAAPATDQCQGGLVDPVGF